MHGKKFHRERALSLSLFFYKQIPVHRFVFRFSCLSIRHVASMLADRGCADHGAGELATWRIGELARIGRAHQPAVSHTVRIPYGPCFGQPERATDASQTSVGHDEFMLHTSFGYRLVTDTRPFCSHPLSRASTLRPRQPHRHRHRRRRRQSVISKYSTVIRFRSALLMLE